MERKKKYTPKRCNFEDYQEIRKNPHLSEVFFYFLYFTSQRNNSLQKQIVQCETLIRVEEDFKIKNRLLLPDAPRKKYIETRGKFRSRVHWGQRKLLLSEIEFLTLYGELSDTVLYAGAAPGTHILFLQKLFPKHNFVLVDPNPFNEELKQNSFIEVREGVYFTDETAKEFSGKNVLFISDIRSANPNEMQQKEHEERIIKDNDAQKQWVQIMKPVKSMLKFRLPYPIKDMPKDIKYLKGHIFLPVWGRKATTETRLVVDNSLDETTYCLQQYEEQMFYFNNVTRVSWYPHDMKYEEYDHCYDCRAEIYILNEYVNSEFARLSEFFKVPAKMIQNSESNSETMIAQSKSKISPPSPTSPPSPPSPPTLPPAPPSSLPSPPSPSKNEKSILSNSLQQSSETVEKNSNSENNSGNKHTLQQLKDIEKLSRMISRQISNSRTLHVDIESNQFKFAEVSHLSYEEQKDKRKLWERKRRLEDEKNYRRYPKKQRYSK